MNKLLTLSGYLLVFLASSAYAQTSVEVKLVAPMDEARGWCIDIRGGPNNIVLIGGVQAHTCSTYNGRGVAADMAFIMENILDQGEFRLHSFEDKCLTVYEPNPGSFATIETCDGRTAQQIVMTADGRISPKTVPDLCLTVGPASLPGGGSRPLHIIRDLVFDTCDSEIDERQVWELRSEYDGPQDRTADLRYEINPNALPPGGPPGGMGMGMGMGMGAPAGAQQ
jgi:hypothetical protein